jgi:hypothetical protein
LGESLKVCFLEAGARSRNGAIGDFPSPSELYVRQYAEIAGA